MFHPTNVFVRGNNTVTAITTPGDLELSFLQPSTMVTDVTLIESTHIHTRTHTNRYCWINKCLTDLLSILETGQSQFQPVTILTVKNGLLISLLLIFSDSSDVFVPHNYISYIEMHFWSHQYTHTIPEMAIQELLNGKHVSIRIIQQLLADAVTKMQILNIDRVLTCVESALV